METEFDTIRTNYAALAERTFDDSLRQQNYDSNLHNLKEIADALTDQRATFSIDAITDASESFSEDMPSEIDECEQIYNGFMDKTDPDSSDYDVANEKSNTIQAIVHIHWRFHKLASTDPLSSDPNKVSIAKTIIKKLVRCTFQWGTTLYTTKSDFMQMNEDLRDNKSITEILSNFDLRDLQCYGY